jgi:hypothetical protein
VTREISDCVNAYFRDSVTRNTPVGQRSGDSVAPGRPPRRPAVWRVGICQPVPSASCDPVPEHVTSRREHGLLHPW